VVARIGGEEFCVLLPETDRQGAAIKAERLREAVAMAAFPGGTAVTLSLGVACFPADGKDAAELLRSAEAAMQAAKQAGRNKVHLYSQDGLDAAPPRARAITAEDVVEDTGEHSGADDLSPFPDVNRFPTYYERIDQIIGMLRRERAASCLFVDLSRLRRVELEVGVAQYAEVFVLAGNILDGMRGDHLREADIVCRTQEDDGYLCILSPSRKPDANSGDSVLEEVSRRVEDHLNGALVEQASHVIREHPRVIVGHARVLNNSMIRPERLVARLIAECREAAAVQRQRAAQANKSVLQELILGDALTPVYQPIVHLKSGDTFGYEALIRGPRGSPLEAPTTLFSVADEVDLTFELDRACFRTCLRGAVGLEPVHRLFLNLLPLSFYDASFIETEVAHLLEAAAITPANVVFEITERLAIENFASFRRALARYTAMGFGVAIDDVGTRHSNLETVMALRPNLIKVSDVLTRGIARSTVKREMLQSLGKIAEAIDAVVVAEGVEGPDDLAVLHQVGVGYGQGYYLARPGPPFPRLRASVRRAIAALASVDREPIPQPPADYDDEGDSRDMSRSHPIVLAAVESIDAIAQGSGEFLVVGPADEVDEFDEHTKPRLQGPEADDAWEALRGNGDAGRALLDGLRAHLEAEHGDEGTPPPSDETGAPRKPSV
jgi:EAL domain-containing protein (putative c-di-GMP-specific phosphodiesterase class I)/GGDEF domain-containing protein